MRGSEAIVWRNDLRVSFKCSDFASISAALPELKDDEVLIAARYLSIDPYLRGLLDEAPFVGQPIPVGGVVACRGIGEVMRSASPAFKAGDLAFGELGWQSQTVVPAAVLRPVAQNDHPITWQLGVLGIPGITAWLSLDRIASPKPEEVVVVSSAAGTVGSAAGQIVKAAGCKVIGIAGGPQKTTVLRNALGFDDAIDYRGTANLTERIALPPRTEPYLFR